MLAAGSGHHNKLPKSMPPAAMARCDDDRIGVRAARAIRTALVARKVGNARTGGVVQPGGAFKALRGRRAGGECDGTSEQGNLDRLHDGSLSYAGTLNIPEACPDPNQQDWSLKVPARRFVASSVTAVVPADMAVR